MHRALPAILAAVALLGCKKAQLAADQLSPDEEDWVLEVNDELVKYDESRMGGLVEDQTTAKHTLMRIADEQRERLTKALGCNDWRGRAVAAFALGFSTHDDVIGMLIDRLKTDTDTEVRKKALYGLAAHGSENTPVDPIIACLGDPDADIRVGALGTLTKILRTNNDHGALPRVLELLSDPDWRVRGQAAIVLARVARKDTVKAVVEKPLKDDAAIVRLHAVGALFAIAEPECIDPLIGALTDPDPRVCDTALSALERLSGQKFGKEPEKWMYWWKHRRELGMGLDYERTERNIK